MTDTLNKTAGLVRAPLLTTLMQVASRFLLVWGIVHLFPAVAIALAPGAGYSSMLVAWSVTETIRYSYFAVNLAMGSVPGWLTWLRYNTFFVLYPLGIASECWLVYCSLGMAAARFGPAAFWGLVAVLGIYVPGESCFLLFEWCGVKMENLGLTAWYCRELHPLHAYDGAEEEDHAWRPNSEENELKREDGQGEAGDHGCSQCTSAVLSLATIIPSKLKDISRKNAGSTNCRRSHASNAAVALASQT